MQRGSECKRRRRCCEKCDEVRVVAGRTNGAEHGRNAANINTAARDVAKSSRRSVFPLLQQRKDVRFQVRALCSHPPGRTGRRGTVHVRCVLIPADEGTCGVFSSPRRRRCVLIPADVRCVLIPPPTKVRAVCSHPPGSAVCSRPPDSRYVRCVLIPPEEPADEELFILEKPPPVAETSVVEAASGEGLAETRHLLRKSQIYRKR